MDIITYNYRIAVYSFIIPFLFLVLYLIDSWTFNFTNIFFLAVFIISLFPSGITGLLFTYKGLRRLFKENNYEKKDIGYANLIMGIIITGCGIVGLGLAYLM
ncbi:hypothetical protein ACMA1I_16210 [Pontibacter sp. 13R65]